MSKFLTTMTTKGQVTVPAEIRRRLGLRPGEKVSFEDAGDFIKVRRHGSVIERTAGILARPGQQPLSAEEMRQVAARAIAEEAATRGGS